MRWPDTNRRSLVCGTGMLCLHGHLGLSKALRAAYRAANVIRYFLLISTLMHLALDVGCSRQEALLVVKKGWLPLPLWLACARRRPLRDMRN